MSKIQLAFHNSTLSGEEAKKAEITGMLILASDFLKSSRINKAESLVRISKISFPLYLSKTKTGQFLPINPYSSSNITIPIMQLPTLTEIQEFCKKSSNIDLNKLYNKLNAFNIEQANLPGGFTKDQLNVIKDLFKAVRDQRNDFVVLPPPRNKATIIEDLKHINDLVYDEKSLRKAIVDRLNIIETTLKENAQEANAKYTERVEHWKIEIKNKNENLQAKIKERDAKLSNDIKLLEKETERKIKENLHMFLEGVTKNIRSDEKPIEGLIQKLEKLTTKSASHDDIPDIEKALRQLLDHTETFRAAVAFAQRQVKNTTNKEEDLRSIFKMEVEGLKNVCEIDKQEYKDQADRIEKERDKELNELKIIKENQAQILNKFLDLKNDWTKDIEAGIENKGTAMLSEASLMMDNPGTFVEVHIPMYIFQYKKNSDYYTIAVPPIRLPDTMKKLSKNMYFGDKKTVFYDIVVPGSKKLISDWFEEAARGRDLQSAIQNLPNLIDEPSKLRDAFFNSQSLMIDKLKVNKKNIKKANDRLTEVWTSG